MNDDKWRDYRIGMWLGFITLGLVMIFLGLSR